MTEEDDDDDIYADLSTISIVDAEPKVDEEKVKLQSLLEEKEQELNEIRDSRNALEKEKKTLEENISSLFKTAVNELKKKDAVIAELTRQKDSILFRRGKRHNLDDTNGNVSYTSQAIHSKQTLSENVVGFKSVIESSCSQKTSKCEVLSANATTVKLLNKEDTSSDNSSVKSNSKYSGSKMDVPLKGDAEGNCERWSCDRSSKERYTSHGRRSSRSSYNQHISSRRCNREKQGEEEGRSHDLRRHRNSSQEDRKRQRCDTEEDYTERHHSRSYLRSPSPKRSRRESSHERYYDWKKRSSRSSYNRRPPSDSVRVAAQLKSKYSKVDRERSLSRTPVKKQKYPDMVDSSSELVHKLSVVSEQNSTNTEEKGSKTYGEHVKNLFTLPECILGPKDINVDHNVKRTPIGVTAGGRRKNGDGNEGTFPLCKSPRAECGSKDKLIPSDKLTINDRTGINSSGDSMQVKEHRYRNSVNSSVIKHQNKSKINDHTILDSLSNNGKIVSIEKEIHSNNTREEGDSGRKAKSKNTVTAGKGESEEIPITHSDRKGEVHERRSSTKGKENPKGNSSEKKKIGKTVVPPVSLRDKCSDEQHCRISKDKVSNTPASSVDECSGSQILSRWPEAQEDSAAFQTPSSSKCVNQGTGFRSSPDFRTPPLKGIVPMKVSPSFEDPAVIREHKFSHVVFNEQCDFQRPKRKRCIRLSGGSCGNGSDPATNTQRKSYSSLYNNAVDKEVSSGKRDSDQGILTTANGSAIFGDVTIGSEMCSAQSESCQKKLFGDGCELTNPFNALLGPSEENTKQTLASNKTEHSDKKSVTASDTSATSLRNDDENISPRISGNPEINKKADIVSVEVIQSNPKDLSGIKNANETCVRKKNVLNPKVKSGELEANIHPAKVHEERKKCVSSSSLDGTPQGSGSKLSEEVRKKSHSKKTAVPSCEPELGKRVAEKDNEMDSICDDLKVNLEKRFGEKRKLLLERDVVPEADENTDLGLKEMRKPSSDKSDTVSANETLKLESASNKSKPKVQRTIIVSKFRRKAANFQDSPTSVLTQVKSSTKCQHPELVALLDYNK